MSSASMGKTAVQHISAAALGEFLERTHSPLEALPLADWDLVLDETSQDAIRLRDAALKLRTSDVPVAFPTETVYGLGADSTRSAAVRGIYDAKQRPSDNPLIVHVASIAQLRTLLPLSATGESIPSVYIPLIRRFWPGPLTILLPLPHDSILAPEVTAGQSTFGVRMPRHLLALALIKLAGVPIAAPSANASTKPSPTTAEHVLHDLQDRLQLIIDGGPCSIGLESTVIDGLSNPPLILRPGGLSLDEIRSCPGFEKTIVAYSDVSQHPSDSSAPRAPGMKYRHYSPRAKVILFETSSPAVLTLVDLPQYIDTSSKIGIIRTRQWQILSKTDETVTPNGRHVQAAIVESTASVSILQQMLLEEAHNQNKTRPRRLVFSAAESTKVRDLEIWDLHIGPDNKSIAQGLFAALRDLDLLGVDCILVEGIDPAEGDIAAAIMNRLRKAAGSQVSS